VSILFNNQGDFRWFPVVGTAAVGVLGLVTVWQTIVIVSPGSAGVETRLGSIVEPTLSEGLHLKTPFLSGVDVYNVQVQKHEVKATAATRDIQDVTAQFVVNFSIDQTKLIEIRRQFGSLDTIVERIIAPQTQEAFKAASGQYTAEETISKRAALKQEIDVVLKKRLAPYGVLLVDTAIVDLKFSPEFSQAVEAKQVAQQKAETAKFVAQEANQQAQADINRAKGRAEAARLEAIALQAQGGNLVLQREWINKWNGQLPQVTTGNGGGFIFNLSNPASAEGQSSAAPAKK
jgi:regulator of protease activity HflC (stomatin/prohibitin superfamily)